MAYFSNGVFRNVDVRLDGNVYHQCRFENCTLIYGGFGPVGMTSCVFANVRWAFELGPDHAGNYHPLTWLSHMADVSMFGNDPAGKSRVAAS